MCSVPTMKLIPAGAGGLPVLAPAETSEGLGLAAAAAAGFNSRDGPFATWFFTTKVRTIKNCSLALAIWFRTFRAAAGLAEKATSTELDSTIRRGAAAGFIGLAARVFVEVGIGTGVCSSVSGMRDRLFSESTCAV